MDIPTHVAFIMDGNRRWARGHKMALFFGHEQGTNQIEPLIEYAANKGIHYLTFWAFSTENWKRGKEEVSILMEVFRKTLNGSMIERLKKINVRLQTIGDTTKFPMDIQTRIQTIVNETKDNTRITVTFALNYGGREEILAAVRSIIEDKQTELTEELFAQHSSTKDLPDPDLIIRSGGEQRLSGFLPWQSVYSELYFTKTLWPDFDTQAFEEALAEYDQRHRRFGK